MPAAARLPRRRGNQEKGQPPPPPLPTLPTTQPTPLSPPKQRSGPSCARRPRRRHPRNRIRVGQCSHRWPRLGSGAGAGHAVRSARTGDISRPQIPSASTPSPAVGSPARGGPRLCLAPLPGPLLTPGRSLGLGRPSRARSRNLPEPLLTPPPPPPPPTPPPRSGPRCARRPRRRHPRDHIRVGQCSRRRPRLGSEAGAGHAVRSARTGDISRPHIPCSSMSMPPPPPLTPPQPPPPPPVRGRSLGHDRPQVPPAAEAAQGCAAGPTGSESPSALFSASFSEALDHGRLSPPAR